MTYLRVWAWGVGGRGADGVAQEVEHLPSKCEALSSNSGATKNHQEFARTLQFLSTANPSQYLPIIPATGASRGKAGIL
jgi:hypothetical protein